MFSAIYIRWVQVVVITAVKHFLIATGRLKISRAIEGRFDPRARYLFAANHASFGDPLVLWSVLSLQQLRAITPVKVMTARGVYYSLLRPFIWSLGAFPAKTRDPQYSAIGSANGHVTSGYSIGIFPEGGRSLPEAKSSYPGITKIYSAHPELTVVLVHLIWSTGPWWRRTLEVRGMLGEATNMHDASEIMEAIYKV